MIFSQFEILYQLLVFYPLGDPLGAPQSSKTYNMLNFNNFSTTSPLLDLKVKLDRACQDLTLCLRGNLLGVILLKKAENQKTEFKRQKLQEAELFDWPKKSWVWKIENMPENGCEWTFALLRSARIHFSAIFSHLDNCSAIFGFGFCDFGISYQAP